MLKCKLALVLFLFVPLAVVSACNESDEPVTLRLGVSLTPQELATFQSAIEALDRASPEWEIVLESTPQQGIVEKINTQLAANELPDLVRLSGLFAQQWIRQDAFLDLSERMEENDIDLDGFYSGPLEQFRWQDRLWGLPDTAAPDVVFYNKDMFDAAGVPYPDDSWTYEDMRDAAIRLTLDANGRNPTESDFDPRSIKQWGWNGGLSNYWQRHMVRALGGETCANQDCTLMTFTSPATTEAVEWWANLVQDDHAALYDPYGGSQTGVPGDPFIAGKAAMGYNGFFAVGQLNDTGNIEYDIVQPLVGVDGKRYTPLSTTGYAIAASSEHADEAWDLLLKLVDPTFLAETWGKPGHSVPAQRSVADSVINLDHAPVKQDAIVAAMEYGEIFKPYTSAAFEAFGKTTDFFQKAMKGEMQVAEALAQIEAVANEVLARDREP